MVQAWDSVILSGLHQWPLSVQQEGLERVGDTQLVLERTAGGQVGLSHRPGVRDMAPFPSPRAAGMSAYHRGGRDAGRKEARRVQGGRYRSLLGLFQPSQYFLEILPVPTEGILIISSELFALTSTFFPPGSLG